jgi:hypothetical protein
MGAPSPASQAGSSARVSGDDFTCRLPVLAGSGGGFITFPNGTITVDRSVKLDPFKGAFSYTYDARAGVWLPVPATALSPDGRSYAYLVQTSGVPGATTVLSLHTHEIASGRDRILWEATGSPPGPNAVTWISGGIYFSAVLVPTATPNTVPLPAVYVSDPNHAGPPRRVGPNPPPQPPTPGQPYSPGLQVYTFIGGGAAWATGYRIPKQPASPNSPPSPGDYGPDSVLRMDLSNGTVSTWYRVSGPDLISLMGLDGQGRPIVAFTQPNLKAMPQPGVFVPPVARLVLLTGPNQTVEISGGNPDFHPDGQLQGDSHGVWFGSWNSVWLYTGAGGLRQVASIPAGLFPTPTPPPGLPPKGGVASSSLPGIPAYMQGTLIRPAGPCA